MQIIDTVVISAAGVGSRLGLNLPKCLIELNGCTLLGNLLQLTRDISSIYIVVGFMEGKVIEEALKYRKDIIFVRNSDFSTTSNTHSILLASQHISKRILIIDADVYLEKKDVDLIIQSSNKFENFICVTPSKTQDAVFVNVNSEKKAIGFSRKNPLPVEWTGIAVIYPNKLTDVSGFVFNQIEKMLPIDAVEIDSWEIDTPEDLEKLQNQKATSI